MPTAQQHTESDAMTWTSSARRSLWYRIPLVLLYLATAGATGPIQFTPAGAAVASPSVAEPCQYNELNVSSPINPIATVYAPGQVGTENATVHNPTPADFTDAYFVLQLIPASAQTTAPPPTPTISWSIDGKGWPGMSLSWTVPPAPQSRYWHSNDTDLPTITAGSTHTLSLQASFHTDSPTGTYWGILTIYARACFNLVLGTTANISYDYFTDLGPTGCCAGDRTGSSSSNTGAGRPPSAPPTAPASGTPGAPGASPAPTESVNTVTLATPSASATPTPKQARNASSAGAPKTAWLAVLLVLAVAALIGLAGQVINTIRRRRPLG